METNHTGITGTSNFPPMYLFMNFGSFFPNKDFLSYDQYMASKFIKRVVCSYVFSVSVFLGCSLVYHLIVSKPHFFYWCSCSLIHYFFESAVHWFMCTYSLVHKFMFFCHCIFGKHLKFLSILLESCPRKGPKDSI